MASRNQRRVCTVLQRMIDLATENEEYADDMAERLDDFVDQFSEHYGDQYRDDPRGDAREDTWTMEHVEGVDG